MLAARELVLEQGLEPGEPDEHAGTGDYQAWIRDPAHPDGTGTALSDAVEVEICE